MTKDESGTEMSHQERMTIAKRFVAWIAKEGVICDCCADDHGMAFTRELASIIAGLREHMSMEQVVTLLGIPPEALENDPQALESAEGRETLALLREIHELLPGAYERWRQWEADEQTLRPFRRRARDVARELKAKGIKGEINSVNIEKGSVKRLAKALRGAHQLALAPLLEQLGLLERARGASN